MTIVERFGRALQWGGLADELRLDGDPTLHHGDDVRVRLVDWATAPGPVTSVPSDDVVRHLTGLLADAEAFGKSQGIVLAAVLCWVPAVLMIVIAILVPGGSS